MALIFDMDGVIVDSSPLHRKAWEALTRRYGVELSETMLRRTHGRRNDDILREFFGAALSAQEAVTRGAAKEELFRQMVRGRIEEILVPGIRQFLELHRGAPMGLASNAGPDNVEFLLEAARLRSCFGAVVDGHQVSRPKPHPEIYLVVAEQLGVRPRNCIVFEDSHSGVEAARAAGARVIGICTTHVNLPGTDLNVDNFQSGMRDTELETWLRAQHAA